MCLQRNLRDRDLLYRRARLSITLVSREMYVAFLTPPFDTSLRQGGVGGANRSDRRPYRSLVFAPMPRGTDTARPADRS